MAYGTPTDPVAGTVITVAYAVANLLDPIRALRAFTGGADPPGSNFWLRSTSTSAVSWVARATEVLSAIGYTPVNKAGDSMAGELFFADGTGVTLGASSGTKGRLYDASTVLTVLRGHNDRVGIYNGNLTVQMADFQATSFTVPGSINGAGLAITGAASISGALNIGGTTTAGAINCGPVSAASASVSGAVSIGGTTTAGAINSGPVTSTLFTGPGAVPLGAVVWFETLAELTAAGASWQRYTAADGRLLVGAGASASGQTFTQATNYGSDWTPVIGASVSDTIGINVGSLDVGGSMGGASSTKTATAGAGTPDTYALDHTHGIGGLSVVGAPGRSGSASLAGTTTVWLPYMRAGIWGRRI